MKYAIFLPWFILCFGALAEDDPSVNAILEEAFERFLQYSEGLLERVEKDPESLIDTSNTRNLFHRIVIESSDQRLKILFAITELGTAIDYLSGQNVVERDGDSDIRTRYLQMIKHRDILAREYVALGVKPPSEPSASNVDAILNEVFKKIGPRIDKLPDGVETDPKAVRETSNALNVFNRTVMASSDTRLKTLFAIAALNLSIDYLGGQMEKKADNDPAKKDYLQMIRVRKILAKEYVSALRPKENSRERDGAKRE